MREMNLPNKISSLSYHCLEEHPAISSKASELANSFLLGNDVQTSGLLLRAPDNLDITTFHDVPLKHIPKRERVGPTLLHPSSYLHASLRAPNILYRHPQAPPGWGVGIVIGTKLIRQNSAQKKGVKVPVCHPYDAASVQRISQKENLGVLKTSHGQGCGKKNAPNVMRLTTSDDEGSSKKRLMTQQCRCRNTAQLKPADYADFFLKNKDKRFQKFDNGNPNFLKMFSCWFEGSRMDELIEASNSLFLKRDQWRKFPSSSIEFSDSSDENEDAEGLGDDDSVSYNGWNECLATEAINDREMIDSIVIQLPPMSTTTNATSSATQGNVCKTSETFIAESFKVLQKLHLRYSNATKDGMIPIIFLSQTRLLDSRGDDWCSRHWKGENCHEGYRKEFITQTFDFENGSCLAMPYHCENVYFFPSCQNKKKIMSESDWCRNEPRRTIPHAKIREKQLDLATTSTENDPPLQSLILVQQSAILLGLLSFIALYCRIRRKSPSFLCRYKSHS